jgi:hypothetical protein
MATRSTISLLTKENVVKTIYCHFDGYLSNNGNILKESYTDYEKITSLIALGSLSSLNQTIESCFAYHRDRNEDLEITVFKSLEEYLNKIIGYGEEFNYIFIDGKWYYSTDNFTEIKNINDLILVP